LPYIAELEKAGIATVLIDYEDQHNMVMQEALINGVPNARFLPASRTLPGPADVDTWIESLNEALTKPLTEKEEEGGKWEPPQPRVLFEGTLDEAQEFYQQTQYVPSPVNAPISIYTDGLPIIVPTEEKVREMLTGTSHKPDEVLTYHHNVAGAGDREGTIRKKGNMVRFMPLRRTATVEQVAVNAVMAGCKPEHLPVVLAIAESTCWTGTTCFEGQAVCLSGPIVKEIGMNTGTGMLDPGSPANMPIGRAYQIMAINLGGAVPGVNRMNAIGCPLNAGGTCYAEDAEGLPPGWEGLNEEYGFRKDESVVMVQQGPGGMQGAQFSPGGYRAFQKSGHGAMARRLGVKGEPGPHNWLEYIVPNIWATRERGFTFIMIPEMARHLYEIGFKSKQEVYEWLWKKSFEPLKDYRNRSWPDLFTDGWMGIETTSGKHWKELPDDYLVPAGGNRPFDSCIIVAGGQEEICQQLDIGHGPCYSIDVWR